MATKLQERCWDYGRDRYRLAGAGASLRILCLKYNMPIPETLLERLGQEIKDKYEKDKAKIKSEPPVIGAPEPVKTNSSFNFDVVGNG